MPLALLHRRLVAGMGLSALAAFAAGAGLSPTIALAAAGLALAMAWQPGPRVSRWVELGSRVGVLVLCAWMMYVAFVLVGDFMPAVLAMLLFLLVAECLRSLDARNDMRLYSLSFALLIAATAYYPGLGFAAGFIAYVVLATLGMMVGFLRRQGEQFRLANLRIGRRFLVATAALSGVTLLMSAVLFVVFPRLPRQWNVQGRRGAGQVMAGFSDQVSIGEVGSRISANPEVAFRVEFPDGPPAEPGRLYWRGRSFDRFDGVRWSRSPRLPAARLAERTYAARWGGPYLRTRVFGVAPGAPVLFAPHPVVDLRPRSAIRTFTDPTGDVLFFGSDMPVYTVTSAAPQPPADSLRAAPAADALNLDAYLALPPRLSPRVRRLADSLTAGLTGRLEQVRAMERYLKTEFSYTLDLPRTRAEATLEGFLFRRRQGHCEYFSTALAVLLRARGIPARNVTGFLGGEWNEFGRYLAVTGNDAHAWVEVWFPRYGWVPFDATPPGRAALVGDGAGSWAWPALFWLDGIEYRWYKWVIDYNLDKQVALFRDLGDMFSREPAPAGAGAGAGRGGGRPVVPWLVLGAAAAWLLAMGAASRKGRGPGPESRAYLALRRAYERAGWVPERGAGAPLAFAEALEKEGAPGAGPAGRVIGLYVRARFGGHDIGPAGREEMAAGVAAVRDELRRSPRARRGRTLAGR